MIRVSQIITPAGTPLSEKAIAAKLGCRVSDILSYRIERRSIDARHEEPVYSYAADVEIRQEEKYLRKKDVSADTAKPYVLPQPVSVSGPRPLVAGFGPAGMFAALVLAECGAKPVVIERGKTVDERACDVERFFKDGVLDPESNVQFGEGGAGTFSDGKLTTRIHDLRVRKVLEELVEAGADPVIMYDALPHVGTDVLRGIVKKIREKVISLGGSVLFETKLESLVLEDGALKGVMTNRGMIECDQAVLCLGHSAQDTFRTLYREGLGFIPKDFAAGVRVEHPQKMINEAQYGRFADHPALGAASYRLTHHASTGRGVYSFCMCPGGVVVPASTEEGTLAVNGMSYSARDGKNANSAILVQIPASDFYKGDPLDGFVYQRMLEKKAYRSAFRAPAMNIADFINGDSAGALCLESSFPRGVVTEDLHPLFSEAVGASLAQGLQAFGRKIPGFDTRGIMVGMESRSSCPVRIPRDEQGSSLNLRGIYPCGEGAGYAGGIVSSAVDGIRQAENVIRAMKGGAGQDGI